MIASIPPSQPRPTVHCAPQRSYAQLVAEAEARREDPLLDTAEDWIDDEVPLTQVFPDGFSAPCEHCGGPSFGDRYCVDCELYLERFEPC